MMYEVDNVHSSVRTYRRGCVSVDVPQGGLQPRIDSDMEETSEVEEEQGRPVTGSESESSMFGLTKKKKKKKPKEKKEKKPRKKKRDEDDDDDDDDDGSMKVSRRSC